MQLRLFTSTLAVASIVSSALFADDRVDFNRDIRPLLSSNCFQCHGPDESNREADLRLDLESGGQPHGAEQPVIVPGVPDQSELYLRVASGDAELRMPPPGSGKALMPDQIALLKRWIEQGAVWQTHWSFVAPRRAKSPAVRRTDWVRHPIDRFVLARLENADLQPSPEADRRTLIRRLALDLTGLPPTRQQVRAFLEDTQPRAYERLVDRLLDSRHYGEHMTRFWLDAARYGDTHGLHLDNYREIWPYRDWVIRAFNDNLSFDRFTVAQLAGDLLPQATLDELIATGFNRCHVTTNEGGTIPEEFYVRNVVDRVETMGTVFLGLTLGCAVCHDHKFDPVSQAEFYQLFAFFNSLDGAPMDGNVKDHYPVVKVPTDKQAAELAKLQDQLAATVAERHQRIAQIEPAFQDWLVLQQQPSSKTGEGSATFAAPDEGLVARYSFDDEQTWLGRPRHGDLRRDAAATNTRARSGEFTDEDPKSGVITNSVDTQKPGRSVGKPEWISGRFGGGYQFSNENPVDLGQHFNFQYDQAFSLGCWLKTPGRLTAAVVSKTDVKALRRGYELTVDRLGLEFHLVSKWQSYAIDVKTVESVLVPDRWQHVFVTYDGSSKAAGIALYVDGARQSLEVKTDSIKTGKISRSITTSKPLLLGRREGEAPFTGGQIDEFCIYDRRLGETEVAQVALAARTNELVARSADRWTDEQIGVLRHYHAYSYDAKLSELVGRSDQLRQQETGIRDDLATTLVFRELPQAQPAFKLERGQYDLHGEQVARNTPATLPSMSDDLPRDRLGLARWLLAPEQPLTSRVVVNRFWQQVFGVGIVKTAEDFGSQGEPPSHPDLLDWLAVDFRETGWDVKRLMKSMVTSATYRQSSRAARSNYQRDPENRLLARGSAYRLDAETLRDQALSLSGLLVPTIGGPSVKPPQPDGIWFAVGYSGSDTVRFTKDEGPEKVYRRSLYTFWKRTAPPPQMSTFDAPSREACVVRRERTNTPLQALLLMNDPQYVEAARFLAQRTVKEGGRTTQERASFVFEIATARAPSDAELAALLSTYEDHHAQFLTDREGASQLIAIGETPPDPTLDTAELAAWTMVANLVLNLDEVITKG